MCSRRRPARPAPHRCRRRRPSRRPDPGSDPAAGGQLAPTYCAPRMPATSTSAIARSRDIRERVRHRHHVLRGEGSGPQGRAPPAERGLDGRPRSAVPVSRGIMRQKRRRPREEDGGEHARSSGSLPRSGSRDSRRRAWSASRPSRPTGCGPASCGRTPGWSPGGTTTASTRARSTSSPDPFGWSSGPGGDGVLRRGPRRLRLRRARRRPPREQSVGPRRRRSWWSVRGRANRSSTSTAPDRLGPARRRALVYSPRVTVLGGELAVPCTRDPLQRG